MQHTVKKSYTFTGKGLHTGRMANMTLRPAEAGSGIRFLRTDISPEAIIPALASNVSSTDRGTTITCGDASVSTIEHLMILRLLPYALFKCYRMCLLERFIIITKLKI